MNKMAANLLILVHILIFSQPLPVQSAPNGGKANNFGDNDTACLFDQTDKDKVQGMEFFIHGLETKSRIVYFCKCTKI